LVGILSSATCWFNGVGRLVMETFCLERGLLFPEPSADHSYFNVFIITDIKAKPNMRFLL